MDRLKEPAPAGRQTRREFLGAVGALSLAGPGPLFGRIPGSGPPAEPTVVLFQGDSITDARRVRDQLGPNHAGALGNGYPFLIAAGALRDHPRAALEFYNRGISGNKIPDLAARWQKDTLELQPDVLSILVGVNDFWHKLGRGYTGTVATYEEGFGALLDSTREALPEVKLVVLEPFVLRTGAVDARWFPEFDERRAAAKRVAYGAGAVFVPLQAMFDSLALQAPPEHWAADGVHPTLAGHAAIAERWREVVGI